MPGVCYLDDDQVEGLLPLSEAITTLRHALSSDPATAPVSMPKALGTWSGGSLHALGAHWSAVGYAGVKTWINTSEGAQSLYCLFDSKAGSLLGFLQARVLGRLRTAAVSALALQVMAPLDTDTIAILGTGRQARTQLAAAAAVLPLTRVTVWSPNREHRTSFSTQMAQAFGIEVVPVASVTDAVRDVRVIISVTRAREPFLEPADLHPDIHINAMGAILPGAAELSPDVVRSARSIVVDDVASALANSTELQTVLNDDPDTAAPITSLVEALRSPEAAYRGVSIFKSVGLGACDLALAARVYEAASSDNGAPRPRDTTPTHV